MRVTGDWYQRPETRAVCDCLGTAGHQALFVGGCVRNDLLGAPVGDIDIATDATPEEVMRLAREAGLKPVPTGIDHGTVTVISEGRPHEITTFRRDVETDGRHATVAFSDRIEEDAERRDFTMNALYADADGEVVDPLGGLEDLRAGRVRFIGDAAARLREDYLRALRFFRFTAWYGDPERGFDPEGLAAIAAHLDGLDTLSRERVGAEMLKLLSAPDPAPAVAAMEQTGVLTRLLPGATARTLPVLVHLEQEAGLPPLPLRRLATLGAQDIPDALRLSKAQARHVELLQHHLDRDTPPGELGYRTGSETARDVLFLRAAALGDSPPMEALMRAEEGARSNMPVRARDFMPAYQGAELGQLMKNLERRWIESGFALTREDLLKG